MAKRNKRLSLCSKAKVNDMKCLNCDTELEQTEGKREKQFCNSTCRSNYWQKAKRKKKYENNIVDLAKGVMTDRVALNKTPIDFTDKAHTVVQANIGLSIYERQKIDDRIKQLETELKSPPSNPLIGKRQWVAIREQELKKLKTSQS